jgi:hypothetical protein
VGSAKFFTVVGDEYDEVDTVPPKGRDIKCDGLP